VGFKLILLRLDFVGLPRVRMSKDSRAGSKANSKANSKAESMELNSTPAVPLPAPPSQPSRSSSPNKKIRVAADSKPKDNLEAENNPLISSMQADNSRTSVNVRGTIRISVADDHSGSHGKCQSMMISPDSKFRTAWDFCIAIFVSYLLLKVPLAVFPGDMLDSSAWSTFDVFLDVFFWLDIILNFRTGYVHGKHVVMDPTKVAKHYLSFWFWIDILACFPFEQVLADASKSQRKIVKLWKIFKLTKLLRMQRVIVVMRDYFKYRYFILIFFLTCFISHVATCFWAFVANAHEPNRYVVGPLTQEELYWLVLEQVFYHIFHGRSKLERKHYGENILSIVFVTFGTLIMAFFGGLVVSLLSNVSNNREKFRQKMSRVAEQMDELDFDHGIQHEVREFYEHIWASDDTKEFKLHRDPDLTEGLRVRVAEQLSDKMFPIRQIPVLSTAPSECVCRIMLALHTEVLQPGEYLMKQGDPSDALYYIFSGQLEVWVTGEDGNPVFVATQNENNIVGESALMSSACRNASIKAATHCNIKKLVKTDLMVILQDYPEIEKKIARFEELEDEEEDVVESGFEAAEIPGVMNRDKITPKNKKEAAQKREEEIEEADPMKLVCQLVSSQSLHMAKLKSLTDTLHAVMLQIHHLKDQIDDSKQMHM